MRKTLLKPNVDVLRLHSFLHVTHQVILKCVHVYASFSSLLILIVRDTEDDDIAFQRNSEELQRDKPRKEILLSLSRQTYHGRRASVLSNAEDVCVQSLLSEYPELKKPYVVSFICIGVAYCSVNIGVNN